MGKNIPVVGLLAVIFLDVVPTHSPSSTGSRAMASEQTYSVQVPELFRDSFREVRRSRDIRTWPQTDVLRAAPPVDAVGKGLLSAPELITRESGVWPGPAPFTDQAWLGGQGAWDWSHYTIDPAASSLELPPEEKTALLNSLRPDERNDPNLVQEMLDKATQRYRRHLARQFAGQIRLKICVAPNSQAAYEYLMRESCSMSSLPIDSIKAKFSETRRVDGVGVLGFAEPLATPREVMFVRDNIAVMIDGRGDLARETLELARKIDSLILKQPVRTREELAARAPSITVSANLKTSPYGQKSLPFEVSAPAGQTIINVAANVGDESVAIRDAEISLGRRVGKAKIKVVAITDELLVGTREMQVDIPVD